MAHATTATATPSTEPIRRTGDWLLAAHSAELRAAPLARTVASVPIVLFRDSHGRPVAMEDRCPHKNVALSLGRVVGDSLQCRYHGWRFERDGGLIEVPCHSPEEKLPRCAVPAFTVVEQDDWIWLTLAPPGTATGAPSRYEKWRGYRWFELHNVVDAPVDLVLENGLDCSHTGFAHEGLFRSSPKQFVTAVIEETATGVRVETQEEESRGARDIRRALGRGQSIRHIDEVILPHTLKVDYWIGERAHIVTILVCTPEVGERTRLFTRMGVRYGPLTPLVARYVEWVTRRVVRQDLQILESQAARIRSFGGRAFRHVMADQPTVWMQRAQRRRATGVAPETLGTRHIVYKL